MSEHTFVSEMTVGSVLIPRFSLIAAGGDRERMLTEPLALAPEAGTEQAIGEVSRPAEAFGVCPGMALSEALSRCPRLRLVSPDPDRAGALWERSLRRLEGIGAEVESDRPGEAFFAADPLCGLWGPHPGQVIARAGRAIGIVARLGGGPTRFCAYAVASTGRRRRRPRVVSRAAVRHFLDPLPVTLLRGRLPDPEGARLVETLERLGVATLGELCGLPRVAVADRFGRLGLLAHGLAAGRDAPLRPRRPHEELVQAIGLPEGAYGTQLDRALELLIERLVADPERRGRSFRALRLEARLAGGGSWRAEAPLRSATADPRRLRLAISPKLAGLQAPVAVLTLRALDLGPGGGEQRALAPDGAERRRERVAEAVRQARAVAGRDALLRVVEVDPHSRIPERRAMLVPHSS